MLPAELNTCKHLGSPVDSRENDWMGRRIRKTVSTNNGHKWAVAADTKFVYDGWNVLVEPNGSDVVQRKYLNFAANKDKKFDACECEENKEVAKRGPHTASVTGTYSTKLKYDGVPKELK